MTRTQIRAVHTISVKRTAGNLRSGLSAVGGGVTYLQSALQYSCCPS